MAAYRANVVRYFRALHLILLRIPYKQCPAQYFRVMLGRRSAYATRGSQRTALQCPIRTNINPNRECGPHEYYILLQAVIGAGAAGMTAVRELRREGHRVEVFEQAPHIGGVWVLDEQVESDPLGKDPSRDTVHSSMYDSLRVNLPRELMGFADFPFLPEFMQVRFPLIAAIDLPTSLEIIHVSSVDAFRHGQHVGSLLPDADVHLQPDLHAWPPAPAANQPHTGRQ